MKTLSQILLAALAALPLVLAAQEADPALEAVRERVAKEFDEIRPEHVHPGPVAGWYTIRKGAIVAYISADGRYLLQGDIIDLDAQANLTEQERNVARSEMLATLDENEAIVFSPDNVRHRISVFTDIDCGYCRRLHQQIDAYLEKGIEIRYLLYPRNGPASESWTKAEQVWCSDDRNQALTLAKQDKDFETHQCDSGMVSEHYALGRDVGLRGTPAIVFEDGTLVSGYLSPDRLASALDEAPVARAETPPGR